MTRLGIQADWESYLGSYIPRSGIYGFRIVIQGVTASTSVSAQTAITKEMFFTNYDMYGNTYAYYTPYQQQKVLDISDFTNIYSIDIYFYQDYNFIDTTNTYIYDYYEDGEDRNQPPVSKPYNLSFENLEVYLGVSAEDIKSETTFLYSHGALNYTGVERISTDEETGAEIKYLTCDSIHDLNFVWVHYEENGLYTIVNDDVSLSEYRAQHEKHITHVYWYRYLYDEDINNDEYKDWDESNTNLTNLIADWNDALQNPNYKTKMERYGGANWTFLPGATDLFNINIKPRADKSREKIKVVVQHDGTYTTSKELILKNTRDIEAEFGANAANDSVILKCFRLKKTYDEDHKWTGNYEAVEDGSANSFHVYDENNTILYNDDNERFDEHDYYLQIHVRNDDTKKYELLTTIASIPTEEVDANGNPTVSVVGQDTNTQIAWALPQSYSMIKSTQEVNEYDAAYFGIDAFNDPLAYQNFHNATIKFSIQSIYNNRYNDNTIGAIITRNSEELHIEKALMFGRAEGLGHDYLPVLEILIPEGNTYLSSNTEFQIACAVYNKDGSLFETPSALSFTWRELSGENIIQYYDESTESIISGYKVTSYTGSNPETREKYRGYLNNVVTGELVQSDGKVYPPIFEVTVHGAGSYPLTVRQGFLVCLESPGSNYKQTRSITVPTRIEFKSDGSNPIFYNSAFEVVQEYLYDNKIKYLLENPEWHINNDKYLKLEKRSETIKVLKLVDGKIENAEETRDKYTLAYKSSNPQWTDDYLSENNYTYLYYSIEGDTEISDDNIYIAQSIAFDRNCYSSSLVNDWNGISLTWNEDEGAILSTMIAAGSKDNNNKFTGVMMGDWNARGDESLDVPGMYGYDKGIQTFGFKTNGTGFIGATGRGRIEFDGNQALISNSDRSCYINLNPARPNLMDLNDVSNQSFSENFIYCKVPKSSNLFTSTTNSVIGNNSWVKEYFEDVDNDYFVVDPNYGVVTTGGVVARYGALGNWMISNQGIYQKGEGKYMYIGYDYAKDKKYEEDFQEARNIYERAKQDAFKNKTSAEKIAYREYQTKLNAYNRYKYSNNDTVIETYLYNFDLKCYRNIGFGLRKAGQFVEKCIPTIEEKINNLDQLPENKTHEEIIKEYIQWYFDTTQNSIDSPYRLAKNAIAGQGWHEDYEYDLSGEETIIQHNVGYDLIFKDVFEFDDELENPVTEKSYLTYEGKTVTVPHINTVLTETVLTEIYKKLANLSMTYYRAAELFEIDYNKQVVEAWDSYINTYQTIYNNKISAIEAAYQEALAEAKNAYDIAEYNYESSQNSDNVTRYCIYASKVSPDELFGPVVDDDHNVLDFENGPYFYVTWDGTMYARKGKIANTWSIDDTSLQYKKESGSKTLTNGKIFDKIYIGKGESNTGIINPDIEKIIYPIEETRPNTQRWAISAGERKEYDDPDKEPEDYINFGVTLSGELYAQLGNIGGWKLSSDKLESSEFTIDGANSQNNKNKIILNAKEGKIEFSNGTFLIDGKTGNIYLGKTYSDGTQAATVYIANYSLHGVDRDNTVTTDGKDTTVTPKATVPSTSSDDVNYGWSSLGKLNVSVDISETNNTDKTPWKFIIDQNIEDPNFFSLTDSEITGDTAPGYIMATGLNDSQNPSMFLYPSMDKGVLGIESNKWDIIANNISASGISAGGISAEQIYRGGERVVTEEQLYNLLNELWEAIDALNQKSGGAAQKARAALGAANSALEELRDFAKATNSALFSVSVNLGNIATVLNGHQHDVKILTYSLDKDTMSLHFSSPEGSESFDGILTDNTNLIQSVGEVTSEGPSGSVNLDTGDLNLEGKIPGFQSIVNDKD